MLRRLHCNYPKLIRNYYTIKNELLNKNDRNVIAKQIHDKIKISGPITVADYMKHVLVNPTGGYYMVDDVFGETGDFITSPELSQLFGEMVGVWFLNEWTKAGSPAPMQIVELGPGRGSLLQDILKVFNHFRGLNDASVELVEVSPFLSDLQSRKLCINTRNINDESLNHYKEGVSLNYGIPIRWYKHLDNVPNDKFTLLVAHEFFDALPIHKFQLTKDGYREILVDIDVNENSSEELKFRYVLAKNHTPASKLLINRNERRDHVEVSPESILLIKAITDRLVTDGGLALIADYGHHGEGTDTFRAYKKHKQQHPLKDIGTADLTADVDFFALKQAATENDGILVYGPVNQRDFLLKMGIEERVKKLMESSKNDEERKSIDFSYHMMVDEDKMGKRFKLLSILPETLRKIVDKYPVAGF